MAIHRVILDTKRGIDYPERITIVQGERNSEIIEATILDEGQPYSLEDKSIRFCAITPAGQVQDDENITVQGNVITYAINPIVGAQPGLAKYAYFDILEGDSVVESTSPIEIMIDPGVGVSLPSNYFGELERLQAEYLEMAGKMNDDLEKFKYIVNIKQEYQEGTSGSTRPTGTWSTVIPAVGQGRFLWTRYTVEYSDGSNNQLYMSARQGQDNTTWGAATTAKDGLMSASDKKNLDDLKAAWDSANSENTNGWFRSHGRAQGDLNDIVAPGIYQINAAVVTNFPNGAYQWGMLIVFTANGNYCLHIYAPIVSTGKKWFYRVNSDLSSKVPWSDWKLFIDLSE